VIGPGLVDLAKSRSAEDGARAHMTGTAKSQFFDHRLLSLSLLTVTMLELVLPGERRQHLTRRAKIAAGVELLFRKVLAIGAVQITDRPPRIEHDVESTH